MSVPRQLIARVEGSPIHYGKKSPPATSRKELNPSTIGSAESRGNFLKDRAIFARLKAAQYPHYARLYSAVLAALLIALCTVGVPPEAQPQAGANPPSAQPSPLLKIESNLVVVKVTVRDGSGHLVPGLKKEDFKIFDRGKEQPISQFEEASPAHPPAALSSLQANPQALTTPQRYIAFYFDDLNSSSADMIDARDAADAYLASSLHYGDHVAIFTTTELPTDFTADPSRIHAALFQLQSHSRISAGLHQCPDLTDYQAQEMVRVAALNSDAWRVALAEARVCAPPPDPRSKPESIRNLAETVLGQAQSQARANLLQLAQVIKYIAQAPGQRTVILASSGFLSESERLIIDRTIEQALRAQVTINSLNPSGLAVMLRESDATHSSISIQNPRAMADRDSLNAARSFFVNDVLAAMAQGTGGIFFRDDNDLKAGFDALLGPPENYTLAFAPREIKPDGKFHELKVTFSDKRKGYTILGRRGYFAVGSEANTVAPLDAENESRARIGAAPGRPDFAPALPAMPIAPSSEKRIEKLLQDALNSKSESTGLPLGIDAAPSEGSGETRILAMTVHLDSRALPLRIHDGHNLDALTFVIAVYDDKGNPGQIKDQEVKIDVQAEELPDFLTKGVDVNTMFELKPGNYRVRVAAIESEQDKLGTISQSLNIP